MTHFDRRHMTYQTKFGHGLRYIYLPGRQGSWGGITRDNRQFINAVLFAGATRACGKDYRKS